MHDANQTQKMDGTHMQDQCNHRHERQSVKASWETIRGIKTDEAQSISQHLKREDEKQIHPAVIQT